MPARLSRLLRSYAVELLNTGIPEKYTLETEFFKDAEELRELEEKPHYMESTDERLDLRHGLGLLLVRQIVEAHGGTMKMESAPRSGYKTIIVFQKPSVRHNQRDLAALFLKVKGKSYIVLEGVCTGFCPKLFVKSLYQSVNLLKRIKKQ